MSILLTLLAFAILTTFAYGGWSAAPWVPSRSSDIERVIKLANLKPGEVFYDLGCGDGRMVAAAARAGAQAVGFEVALVPYVAAQIRGILLRDPSPPSPSKGEDNETTSARYSIRYKNFWNFNFNQADIIYFFLTPPAYAKLGIKLANELKPGARVISYVWPVPGWEPITIDKAPNRPTLYLYIR